MSKIFTVTLNPAVDRELTVPKIAYDTVLRSTESRVDFGGKGFNVSRMLKSLGTASVAVGFAGGKSGELLREGLELLGVDTDFVWVDGETRTNVSVVTEEHDHYLKVNEPGPLITSSEQQRLIEKITHLSQPGDFWVLAGSLPPGVSTKIYAQLTNIIKGAGAKVILDTSGEAMALGCQAAPFLVKPNQMEIHNITGLPVDDTEGLIKAAEQLQGWGVENVIVSLGKMGALVKHQEQAWLVMSPAVQERNPIGAGDSMVGGLVWALNQRLGLLDAVGWGIACGAAAASLSGTTVGTYEYIKELVSQTDVQRLGKQADE